MKVYEIVYMMKCIDGTLEPMSEGLYGNLERALERLKSLNKAEQFLNCEECRGYYYMWTREVDMG